MSLMLARAGAMAAGAGGVAFASVEALRTDLTLSGVQAGQLTKTFGVDAPPTGVNVTSTLVTVTPSFADLYLTGWDFGGRALTVQASASVITENCLFESPGFGGAYFDFVDVYGGGSYGARYCTYRGHPAHPALTKAVKWRASSITLGITERNRYLEMPNDCYKPNSSEQIRWCYFGFLKHVPAGTVEWSSLTTYAAGDIALDGSGNVFMSLVDSNLDNALPAYDPGGSLTDFWRGLTPHGDNITVDVASNVAITSCLIDNTTEPPETVPDATAGEYNPLGLNNALRIKRNTPDSSPFGAVMIRNCATYRSALDTGSAAMEVADGGKAGFNGPIRFLNNWLSPGSGGDYVFTGPEIDEFSGNVDYTTGDPISITTRTLAPPVNTVAPAITGTAAVGEELTVSNGTWTGQPIPAYTYQWTSDGEPIDGATASAFTITESELDTTVACTVTGTNTQGAASAGAAGVEITTPTFATELSLDAFPTLGGAPISFTARRDANVGWVFVSGTGEPEAFIEGRMVGGAGDSAWVSVVDAAGDPVACDAGDGSFAGFIAGGARSLTAYKAQVRYTEAENTPAETSNTCYIARLVADWGQSDRRYLGGTSVVTAGTPAQTATTDNLVQFVTLDRDGAGLVAADAGDLLVFTVAGISPTNREPMWAMGNALMALFPGERIVVACHVVSGSSDSDVVNDAATHESGNPRIWEDEVLIATAVQPHLTEITAPVAYDLVVWDWSTGAQYPGSAFVDTFGPQLVPIKSDGTPVTRGAEITVGGKTWDADHFWSDIYDLDRTKVAFREHYTPAVIAGQEAFEGHPVYGGYVTGFPVSFSRTSVERGRDDGGTWTDITHGSTTTREGQVRDAEIAAAHMAYVLGAFDPGTFGYDYIHWPEAVEDDERYVYVGIVGRDVTTLRYLADDEDPPGAFGQVTHFMINGVISEDVVLAPFEGQMRARLAKPAEAAWTGADTIEIVDTGAGAVVADVGYAPTNADYLSRYTLDAPVVEVGVAGLQALPITTRVSAGFFANPLPLPPSALMVWLGDYSSDTDIGTTPATIMTLESDGSPILIFLGSRSASSDAGLGFPATITLGGVDIAASLVEDGGRNRTKGGVYYVASPAVGSLDLAVSFASGEESFQTVAQAFKVTGGGGVGASPVVVTNSNTAPESATDTASEENVRVVQAVFSTVAVESVTGTTLFPDAEGGRVAQFASSLGVALAIGSKVVPSGLGGGSFEWDGVTTVQRVAISFELLAEAEETFSFGNETVTGTPTATNAPSSRQIAVIGDSRAGTQQSGSTGMEILSPVGHLLWHKVTWNYSVGGSTINDAVVSQAPAAIASGAKVFFVLTGTNGAGAGGGTELENRQAQTLALLAALDVVDGTIFLCNEIPGVSLPATGTPQDKIDHHHWINGLTTANTSLANAELVIVNTWDAVADPATGLPLVDGKPGLTVSLRADETSDGLHPSTWGSERIAKAFFEAATAHFGGPCVDYATPDVVLLDGTTVDNIAAFGDFPGGWVRFGAANGLVMTTAGAGTSTLFTVENTSGGDLQIDARKTLSAETTDAVLMVEYEIEPNPSASPTPGSAALKSDPQISLIGASGGGFNFGTGVNDAAENVYARRSNAASDQDRRFGGRRRTCLLVGATALSGTDQVRLVHRVPAGGRIVFHRVDLYER